MWVLPPLLLREKQGFRAAKLMGLKLYPNH